MKYKSYSSAFGMSNMPRLTFCLTAQYIILSMSRFPWKLVGRKYLLWEHEHVPPLKLLLRICSPSLKPWYSNIWIWWIYEIYDMILKCMISVLRGELLTCARGGGRGVGKIIDVTWFSYFPFQLPLPSYKVGLMHGIEKIKFVQGVGRGWKGNEYGHVFVHSLSVPPSLLQSGSYAWYWKNSICSGVGPHSLEPDYFFSLFLFYFSVYHIMSEQYFTNLMDCTWPSLLLSFSICHSFSHSTGVFLCVQIPWLAGDSL